LFLHVLHVIWCHVALAVCQLTITIVTREQHVVRMRSVGVICVVRAESSGVYDAADFEPRQVTSAFHNCHTTVAFRH